ncbi:ABC transporter permease [Shinella yambaruensis]|uniref:Membrane protein n=1 Tax=Shinella yambaruensis TaxID=415996 RepID=A0ABQ5ZSN1_9HYPH|nr:ABC transporter permease [Shinella yambaruensis]MCJ8028951.1 ABC transporter permease [Shinella yambaruensis]MCU7982007.1 ABC transporter permease [Shinella yambaruensis]GLR54739.1 membrane protein [Shinella yambaruensis]
MMGFILADLRRFKGGALAVVVLIALSVALSVAVTLQERAVRLGSARAAEKFDLVVGAAGSETQLALSAVFLQPSPLPLMSGAVLEKLARDPRVSFAAPVGFGDSADGRPVVGTTTALVTALSPTLAEGAIFARLGEAVIGADVPMRLGAQIKPMHGAADSGGHTHVELAYTVRGRMAPTGTAWDRAILVPIRAVWQLHGMGAEAEHGHDHGDEAPDGAAAEDHDHAVHVEPDAALDEHFDAETPGIPAVLVKPKTMGDAYRLRQEYRSETTLAVFPAEVLTRLYATLGDARSLLLAIAIATQAIVVAAILLVTIMHVGARRRQIGALRAFGAPRRAVFAIVWGELFLLLLAGFALGLAIGYGAAWAISAALASATAVHMPVEFTRADLSLAMWFAALAVLVSIVPALSALRLSPAAALRA